MKIPEVVVFDLGKVLVDFDYGIAAQKISKRGRVTPSDVRKAIELSPSLFRYETGLMSKDEFFSEVCAATGFSGNVEEFSGHFADIFSPIEPMIAWQQQLRAKGIPTYIFSNTNELAVAHIRAKFPFFNHFSDYILSYEHRAMKPDPKLYEVVERLTEKRGDSILYLDDRAENIETGAARNWQTILQETPEKTLQLVKSYGF